MILLLLALFVTGPALSQQPNSACYALNERLEQPRPCKPEERR